MSRSNTTGPLVENAPKPMVFPSASIKIKNHHLDRWALVYVRQSTHHQILDHPESTARQYALVDRAAALGWNQNRIMVIDQDLGISGRTAVTREGFQRLRNMVVLNHVGIVLGLEVSRVARCHRDWHDLFEECASHDTLLSDEDGVYNANDLNDRLVLGMKGIMSEMELHIMKNRLERGRRHKAERGELYETVPRGYVRLPGGGADQDPEDAVRDVVSLVFQTFEQTGTVYRLLRELHQQGIRLPKRQPRSGTLLWNQPTYSALQDLLHHPMYAGAYSFGKQSGIPFTTPHKRWQILILDHLPAYVTWEQYLKNQNTLAQNQTASDTRGPSRQGSALLTGLLVCGHCGRRLGVGYGPANTGYYNCSRRPLGDDDPEACGGLAIRAIDPVVVEYVLLALEPACLDLSLAVLKDAQAERSRQDNYFRKRLERATYDSQLAERRYLAVEPENRLVACHLEQRWQEALSEQRDLQEEHDRFLKSKPLSLTDDEQARLKELSSDIPTLWNASGTSNSDRKDILRCLIERVVVTIQNKTDRVDIGIHWAGGLISRTEVRRPVHAYTQLADVGPLLSLVVPLRRAGCRATEIAKQLNDAGFRTIKRQKPFRTYTVNQLFKPSGIAHHLVNGRKLGPNQWTVPTLSQHLGISPRALKYWVKYRWIQVVQRPFGGQWILWADEEELIRLRWLAKKSKKGMCNYPPEMLTPKAMPKSEDEGKADDKPDRSK